MLLPSDLLNVRLRVHCLGTGSNIVVGAEERLRLRHLSKHRERIDQRPQTSLAKRLRRPRGLPSHGVALSEPKATHCKERHLVLPDNGPFGLKLMGIKVSILRSSAFLQASLPWLNPPPFILVQASNAQAMFALTALGWISRVPANTIDWRKRTLTKWPRSDLGTCEMGSVGTLLRKSRMCMIGRVGWR